MAFSDWTASTQTASVIQISDHRVIRGNTALVLTTNNTPASRAMLTLTTPSSAVTTGRSRALFSVDETGTDNSTYVGVFGFLQTSIGVNSNAYWVVYRVTEATIRIVRGTSDLPTWLPLATFSFPFSNMAVSGEGFCFALQLTWQLNSATNDILLTAGWGYRPDFSDITDLGSVLDASGSKLSAAAVVGAGFALASNINRNVVVDNAEVYGT